MEAGTQNGGGSSSLPGVVRDCGRQLSREHSPGEALSQQVHVLSLDQIRIVRSSNEYSAEPMVAARLGSEQAIPQHPQEKTDLTQGPTLEPHQQMFTSRGQHNHHHTQTPPTALAQSTSMASGSSQTSTHMTASSTSSEQRLLGKSPTNKVIGAQPKPLGQKWEELKRLSGKELGERSYPCRECERCKCEECACLQTPSSRWVCDHRCACSAQNALDYGTCICCVKGLFYHCSSDDEDICADNPCSCSQSHCCLRWSAMAILSLCLPCLWCYLPAKGCLELSQGCYDCIKRPGCRCRDTNTIHCINAEKSI